MRTTGSSRSRSSPWERPGGRPSTGPTRRHRASCSTRPHRAPTRDPPDGARRSARCIQQRGEPTCSKSHSQRSSASTWRRRRRPRAVGARTPSTEARARPPPDPHRVARRLAAGRAPEPRGSDTPGPPRSRDPDRRRRRVERVARGPHHHPRRSSLPRGRRGLRRAADGGPSAVACETQSSNACPCSQPPRSLVRVVRRRNERPRKARALPGVPNRKAAGHHGQFPSSGVTIGDSQENEFEQLSAYRS